MESLKQLYKIGKGPSSSHTMGPERACKYILEKYPQAKKVEITLFGSLALTGKGHLTDKVIYETLHGLNVNVIFNYKDEKPHPNTMVFAVFNGKNEPIDEVTIFSVGGGKIEIQNQSVENVQEEEIYPFNSFDEIKEYCIKYNLTLPELAYKFEGEEIKEHLNKVYSTMKKSICRGLKKDGELPGNLHVLRKAKSLYSNKINVKNIIQSISSFAFAVSEENASGGTIVTAPTCGSCGILPSVLYFTEKCYKLKNDVIIDALAVAGIIGNVIKKNASLSGAFAGCQAEVGSACSMAAAALSYIEGYSLEEIEYSAEIALEHHLGLTCDPINGLVQIPCIERNAVAALRALDASKLAHLLNGTRKVSFDTVVKTMIETGKDLNAKYRETSTGGLATNYNCK